MIKRGNAFCVAPFYVKKYLYFAKNVCAENFKLLKTYLIFDILLIKRKIRIKSCCKLCNKYFSNYFCENY